MFIEKAYTSFDLNYLYSFLTAMSIFYSIGDIFKLFRLTDVDYIQTNYIETFQGLDIKKLKDTHGFKNKHNLSNNQIVNLCGGIPYDKSLITKCDVIGRSISSDEFSVQLTYRGMGKQVAFVDRIIDLATMVIENNEMRVHIEGKGICTNLFINQLRTSIKKNFTQINMHAAGGIDYNPRFPNKKYDGYYHWAKYGYQMTEDSLIKFHTWLNKHNRKERTLLELISTQEGYNLLKHKGESWNGYFSLQTNSRSLKQFKRYLDSKGINALIDQDVHR